MLKLFVYSRHLTVTLFNPTVEPVFVSAAQMLGRTFTNFRVHGLQEYILTSDLMRLTPDLSVTEAEKLARNLVVIGRCNNIPFSATAEIV